MEVLNWAHKDLASKGIEKARLDAEVLLGQAIGLQRLELYTNFDKPLTQDERDSFRESILQRRKGIPVAYIIGSREFYSRDFAVNSHVLIPRPETEQLVEEVVNTSKTMVEHSLSIADIGTGSGCIAVTLALEIPDAKVWATDISSGALQTAKANAKNLQADVTFCEGNLLEPLMSLPAFDIVVSNPPYIESKVIETLSAEVQNEPQLALDGGADGLDLIRILVEQAGDRIKPEGFLFMEIGYNQGEALKRVLEESGSFEEISIKKDYSGHDRIAVGKRKAL